MNQFFSAEVSLRHSHGMALTPDLLQAIKLLHLSGVELFEYVETELEKNPLLERSPDDFDMAIAEETPGIGSPLDLGTPWNTPGHWEKAGEIDMSNEVTLENVFQDELQPQKPASFQETTPNGLSASNWSGVNGQNFQDDDHSLENYVTAEISLHDHLTEQLHVALSDPVDLIIGRSLIDLIDEAGYLREPLPELAAQLGIGLPRVQTILAMIQRFDPSGVGATDLADCLRIQLRERNRYDPAMAGLLDHLHLLAQRNLAGLKDICGVDSDDLAEMIKEIKALDPKPGFRFGRGIIQSVVPDVYVHKLPDGNWHVELNSDTLPRILVNQTYANIISKNLKSDNEKSYLNDALKNANWLTRSLEQRARTILKVTSEIVRHQDLFFAHGVEFLRPLNLRSIADAIGMHESTVSRVTSNKYISSERGLFEMKYFFTASIPSSCDGEAHSAEAVRFRIKQMIGQETPDAILSDHMIVMKLKESGIEIARRTVAKYRDSLRIPSSVERQKTSGSTFIAR